MKMIALALIATTAACSAPAPDAAAPANEATPAPVEATAASPTRAFRYTSLADCPVVTENREEGAYRVTECPGLGGYRVRLVDADARQNLILIDAAGTEHSLELPSRFSGAFSTIGTQVEWRGPASADAAAFRPDRMILRYDAFLDPETPDRPTSHLVIVQVDATPCIVATIEPGADQNDRARTEADSGDSCR